jgi:hypothetical protein
MIRATLISCVLLAATFVASARGQEFATVSGNVRFNGEPLCALVLANGQNEFSCDGRGAFDLSVPLDNAGLITLQVFAAGFAPLRQVLSPEQSVGVVVDMARDSSGRTFAVTRNVTSTARPGWVNVSGTVDRDGTPLCSLVLINGQDMFTCGASLGQYSLDAPQDAEGLITLQVFAFGFQPYKEVFDPLSGNLPPVADAGPDQTLENATTVFLDGSDSTDPNFDPLGYRWTALAAPSGTQASLFNTNRSDPYFEPDVAGDYVFELTVNDGSVDSEPDQVTVTLLNGNRPPGLPARDLLLYEDISSGDYLGCLNCRQSALDSVCNPAGSFGSRFSALSIWNSAGDYGSAFSDSSPWNRSAQNPPVILDRAGGFFGYLTANRSLGNRTNLEALVQLTDLVAREGASLLEARNWFCQ